MALAPVMETDVEQALRHVSPDCPREEWARVLMAIKSGLGDLGEDIARTWSMGADCYNERAFNSTWRSVKSEGGVGIGTLFDLAKRGGWTGAAKPSVLSSRALFMNPKKRLEVIPNEIDELIFAIRACTNHADYPEAIARIKKAVEGLR